MTHSKAKVSLELTDREAEMLQAHLQAILSRAGYAAKFRSWAGTLVQKVGQARNVYRQQRDAVAAVWVKEDLVLAVREDLDAICEQEWYDAHQDEMPR